MIIIIPGILSTICWLSDLFKLHALSILLLWLHQDVHGKSFVQNWNLLQTFRFLKWNLSK